MNIILLGNAGAGKSTMAKKIMGDRHLPYLCLDDIAWNNDLERKPLDQSIAEMLSFIASHDQWIIEGCYADLIAAALPHCTELRFLNPGTDVCVAHCQNRPWEPEKFPSLEAQNAHLNFLIEWVKQYEVREDEYGLSRHREVYDRFTGNKREYTRIEDYDGINS